MTILDLYANYGTLYRASKVLGMTPDTMYVWKRKGYIPYRTQKLLELKTGGLLRARIADGKPLAAWYEARKSKCNASAAQALDLTQKTGVVL